MSDAPTFNEQMVTKLRALIAKNPGASSYTIDGVTTSFVDLEARLSHFESKAARDREERQRFVGFNLGGFLP